ncbi:MAG: ABC transporter substrate-binding protein [Burkholderiales bacterium]|nr:ABC transporter substrate-binding protein [Burkholderiales bacterium]
MIARRRFIVALSLAASPLPAQQPARVYRIGVLRPTAPDLKGDDALSVNLPRALREIGYVEGRNLVIETRFADRKLDRLPALARELVELKVDVIFAVGSEAVRAAKGASATTPIVFFGNFDPVKLTFVASLAKPGGNVTGIVIAPDGTLTAKKVELLAQAVPAARRMAILLPGDPNVAREQVPEARKAAAGLGIDLFVVDMKDDDYRTAFGKIEQVRAQLLFVASSTYFYRDRRQIIDLAARYRLPAMYEWPDQVEDGGLMAYGPPSLRSLYTRIGANIDRILKGTNPADIPVEQPTKLEFVINLKTAKALGLAIPQALLLRADRVIE